MIVASDSDICFVLLFSCRECEVEHVLLERTNLLTDVLCVYLLRVI